MSLRKAINEKCRDCAYDPLDAGSAAQQIACCTSTDCALHPVRPVSAKLIPIHLLEAYSVSPEQLDDRARVLVIPPVVEVGDGQIGPLPTLESISES